MARVLFDRSGDPVGVERLGVALEPEADYEHSGSGGGCEDPRGILRGASAVVSNDLHRQDRSRSPHWNCHI
jgi:hypothetical protein